MATTVRIAGTTFPDAFRPGARVAWTEDYRTRIGTVIDRAAQGAAVGHWSSSEQAGTWYWVVPDERTTADTDFVVRVKVNRDGTAVRDFGAMIARGVNGSRVVYTDRMEAAA